jgi:hypothetical protein
MDALVANSRLMIANGAKVNLTASSTHQVYQDGKSSQKPTTNLELHTHGLGRNAQARTVAYANESAMISHAW